MKCENLSITRVIDHFFIKHLILFRLVETIMLMSLYVYLYCLIEILSDLLSLHKCSHPC